MAIRFNPAPGWPPPPPGFIPPAGWQPDPSWPPAPPNWQFIIVEPDGEPEAIAPRRETRPRTFQLWGQTGWCGFDISGESHYFKALRELLPRHLDGAGGEVDGLTAHLVPEPKNRHDPHAVRVEINGRQVGYLPADEARRYSPVLQSLVQQGWLPAVRARIWGAEFVDSDFDRRGRPVQHTEVRGSVRLDLAAPHMTVPINQPPSAPWTLLPRGGAVQVTGEDKCMDVLVAYLRPEMEAWAFVTLHTLLERTTRTEKQVVEVRVDGQRVGQLTPKMSSDFLPAIDHAADRGGVLAARAVIKGNRLKAEVTLHAARAHELTEDWLRLALQDAGTYDGA